MDGNLGGVQNTLTNQPSTWRYAGVSYQGLYHEQASLPCQDAWYGQVKNGVTVCAVSDGAGSAELSQFGSQLAVEVASSFMCTQFENLYAADDITVRKAIFDCVMPRFVALEEEHGRPLKAFAATLICLAVHEDGRWMSIHLGDGMILVQAGEKLIPLSLPENGEFSNQTWFLTSDGAPRHTRVQKGNGFFQGNQATGFILCSDGVENSLAAVRTGKVAKAGLDLLHLFSLPEEGTATDLLERNVPIFRDRNPDDGTIVLLSTANASNSDEPVDDEISDEVAEAEVVSVRQASSPALSPPMTGSHQVARPWVLMLLGLILGSELFVLGGIAGFMGEKSTEGYWSRTSSQLAFTELPLIVVEAPIHYMLFPLEYPQFDVLWGPQAQQSTPSSCL